MTKEIKKFTLIELLVSMGIFSILLVLSMQFFTSAQRMWTRAEENNNLFSNARLVMDFVATKIQTAYYVENMPFEINMVDQDKKGMIFASREKISSRNDDINTRFCCFRLKGNKLIYQIVSDNKSEDFFKLLPPFTEDNVNNDKEHIDNKKARNILWNFFKDDTKNWNKKEENYAILHDGVIDFSLKAYNLGSSSNQLLKEETSEVYQPPYLIEITLTLLSDEALKQYNLITDNSRKEEFKKSNQYTFKRSVFFSNQLIQI